MILVTVFPLLTLLFSHDGKLFKHLYILSSFLGFFICRPLNWLIKMFRVLFLKSSLIFFLLIYLFYLYYFLLFSFGSLLSALTNCLGSSIICEKEEEEKGKERGRKREEKGEGEEVHMARNCRQHLGPKGGLQPTDRQKPSPQSYQEINSTNNMSEHGRGFCPNQARGKNSAQQTP